jgi:hypothetical protein
MAIDDRDRGRNRGMFGYEGEGYMRGGDSSRGRDRGDFGSNYPPRERYVGEDYFGMRQESDRGRPSFRGRGPKNYQRSDDRIREEVCERLTDADDVDATDIDVSVSGGTVTLSGSVDERYAKRRAEDIVESVAGVRDVENSIRIARR